MSAVHGGPAAELLWRRYPGLAGALPWLGLGRFPTRITPAPRLGGDLGVELWVKRDDESGEGYGGNKVRKLELLLAEARRRGARRVVTVGALASNHVVATAYYARAVGLGCVALLLPQPVTPLLGSNLRAALALGASLVPAPRWLNAPGALVRLLGRLGRGAYVIGPGGSSPLGTVGYVAAAFELEEQVAAGACPEPAAIFVPLGSGGTAAGLLAGLCQTRLSTRVVAVRVVHGVLAGHARTVALARRTIRMLGRRGASLRDVDGRRLEVMGEQLGPGYAAPTPAAAEAVAQAARLEGLQLETTYTGKTLAGLAARARELGGRVLFWHTFSSADLTPLAAAPPAAAVPAALRRLLGDEQVRPFPLPGRGSSEPR